VLLLGAVGAVVALRRPDAAAAVPDLGLRRLAGVYSWAGEKFAWLVMHPLLPLILLAGSACRRSGRARTPGGARRARGGRRRRRLPGVAVVVANAEYGADPREFLVSTQSSDA
jgi:predicted membrane-bound mannosyltransferase